jgi:hypothetical protein
MLRPTGYSKILLKRLVFGLSFAFFFTPHFAAAQCDCGMPPTIAQAAQDSDVVFMGTAKADFNGTLPTKIRFDVEKVWKGRVGPEVTVCTGGICAYPFARGVKYLVFASLDDKTHDGALWEYSCGRTTYGEYAKNAVKSLGAGHAPLNPVPRILALLSATLIVGGCYFRNQHKYRASPRSAQ